MSNEEMIKKINEMRDVINKHSKVIKQLNEKIKVLESEKRGKDIGSDILGGIFGGLSK